MASSTISSSNGRSSHNSSNGTTSSATSASDMLSGFPKPDYQSMEFQIGSSCLQSTTLGISTVGFGLSGTTTTVTGSANQPNANQVNANLARNSKNRSFDEMYILDRECLGKGKFAYVFTARRRPPMPSQPQTPTPKEMVRTSSFYTDSSSDRSREATPTALTSVVRDFSDADYAEEFAVKIYCKESVAAFVRLIDNEIAALKQLSKHPNVLTLIDYYYSPLGIYLVFEKLTGGDLASYFLKKYKNGVAEYTEKQIRFWCRSMLSAIAHCHSHRIVHRDIKPNNIMVISEAEDSDIKLVDFGLAVQVSLAD
jgi:hypothetical protein